MKKTFLEESSPFDALPRNGDLAGWKNTMIQEKIQRIAFQLEEVFQQTGRKPVVELRFENDDREPCFTNAGMDKVLGNIMGDRREQLVETIVINPYQYPGPELLHELRDAILIVGGSVNDTYDDFGMTLSHCFSDPLLRVVNDSRRNIRSLMICFGYQLILEALGRHLSSGKEDVVIETHLGEPQFGLTRAVFPEEDSFLSFLRSDVRRSVALTRAGYVLSHDYSFKDLKRIAQKKGTFLKEIASYVDPEKIVIDPRRPRINKGLMPLGVQIGNIAAVQFHPELDPQDPEVMKPVATFLYDHPRISGSTLFSPDVRSLAPVFFTGLFERFADDIHQFWVQKKRLRKKS